MTSQPISTVLGRGAQEARALGHMAARLDEAIGALSAHQGADADRAALQSADLLRQGIEDLATFLEAISEAAPVDCRIDPAVPVARLALRDLAARISGAVPEDGAAAHDRGVPPRSGEMTLL